MGLQRVSFDELPGAEVSVFERARRRREVDFKSFESAMLVALGNAGAGDLPGIAAGQPALAIPRGASPIRTFDDAEAGAIAQGAGESGGEIVHGFQYGRMGQPSGR